MFEKQLIKRFLLSLSGNLGTAYFAPHRKFYSFRSLYYAAKPTNETRFLVFGLKNINF